MLKTTVNANPLAEFRAFDEMFDRMLGTAHRVGPTHPAQGLLPVDVVERDNSLFVKAAVPGVDPEHIDIQIEANVLTISGELKSDYEDTQAKIYRREYSYGKFSRSIRLPEDLDLENVSAEFNNGFVTITLPRVAQPAPKSLRVPIKHAAKADGATTTLPSKTKSEK
ncbi:MAG: Hsp20/alpha crystallin family protein [Fimbriimonadaceae bacterium]